MRVMHIIRSRTRLAAISMAAAAFVLIGVSVALGSHRPQVGLLADATTVNEVNVSMNSWLRALTIRSEALNRLYGLGDWATSATRPNTAESALRTRGEALNRIYGLERTRLDGGSR